MSQVPPRQLLLQEEWEDRYTLSVAHDNDNIDNVDDNDNNDDDDNTRDVQRYPPNSF